MSICEIEKYFAIAVDPIHVGTGGYRIGRVDNTIVREPSTNLPKIPGTTLEGAARNYAYLRAKERKESLVLGCAKGKSDKEKDTNKQPCGKCNICVTFGYSKDNNSLHALAQFSDAQILFFPVATMVGPVWITCEMVLNEAKINIKSDNTKISESDKFITNIPKLPERAGKNILNLGWILLEKENGSIAPENWEYQNYGKLSNLDSINNIFSRVIIVHNNVFSQIVNMNLEVRTSVAIDPLRGAAEEGALFTYEAVPRGTIFWFDLVYQNPYNFPDVSDNPEILAKDISVIKKTVEDGLTLMQYFGVGGMSTRGFGKIKVLSNNFINPGEYIKSLKNRIEIIKKNKSTDDFKKELGVIQTNLLSLKTQFDNEKKPFEKMIAEIDEVIKNATTR
jgi:CRISPR-associated protein Cmr4